MRRLFEWVEGNKKSTTVKGWIKKAAEGACGSSNGTSSLSFVEVDNSDNHISREGTDSVSSDNDSGLTGDSVEAVVGHGAELDVSGTDSVNSVIHEIHVDSESKVAMNFHVCDIQDGQVHICGDDKIKKGSSTVFTLNMGQKEEGTVEVNQDVSKVQEQLNSM